jgi:hypothetical protein
MLWKKKYIYIYIQNKSSYLLQIESQKIIEVQVISKRKELKSPRHLENRDT